MAKTPRDALDVPKLAPGSEFPAPLSGVKERSPSWRVPAEPRQSSVGSVMPSWADTASAAGRLSAELVDALDTPAAAALIVRVLTDLLPRRAVAVRLGTDDGAALASSRPFPKGEALSGALSVAIEAHARGDVLGGPAGVFGGADGYTVPLVARSAVVGVVAVEPLGSDATPQHEACAVALVLGSVGPSLPIDSLPPERTATSVRPSELGTLDQLAWIVEQAPFPAALVDRQMVVCAVNTLAADALGASVEQLLRIPAMKLAETSRRAQGALERLLRGEVVSGIELENGLPNRRVVWVAVPLLDVVGGFAGAIAFGDDRSAVQILEEQILHAEKLATVGQLAAGIVHELNNPLTSISVYADYLLQKAERAGGDPADVERLRRIAEASARMLRFTRDLVSYARPSSEEPSELAVDGVIDQSIGFVEHVLTNASVRVIVDAAPGLPLVRAVRGQLHQIFVNLLTNATQAIANVGRPNGGAIRITVAADGAVVRVRIADDGPGITSEHIARVFDPFFTTKEAGRGTGLGLSIVRNIVQLHGGTITVESVHAESGVTATGTTFVLCLPIRRDV